MAAAVALNVAVVVPAATVTDAGTVSSVSLLDSEMAVPPMGAAPFSVAVHDTIWPPARLPVVHKAIEERAGPNKLIVVVLDPPFHVPVKVAL